MPVMQEKQMSALGLLRFKIRKPALTRFDACCAGSLLVPDAGKTNVCFAAACFSFASSTLYHKSV